MRNLIIKADRAARRELRAAVAAAEAPFDWDAFLAGAAGRLLARAELPSSFREASPAALSAAVAPHGYRAIFPSELPNGQLLFWPAEQQIPDEALRAVSVLSNQSDSANKDVVFTKPEVVNFILDLIGYSEQEPLYQRTILEPSFGDGDFLVPIVRRLMASWQRDHPDSHVPGESLQHAIRAVELNKGIFGATRKTLKHLLGEWMPEAEADLLLDQWLISGDYLLTSFKDGFDFVAGNPPYIRQERIPDALMSVYRKRYVTLYDRADIYVAFYEHSLSLLNPMGTLGFICSDRWTKNRYGSVLRKMVSQGYHLKAYIDMTGVDAFRAAVTAYPAITIISREKSGLTRFAQRPAMEAKQLKTLSQELNGEKSGGVAVSESAKVVCGSMPWIFAQNGFDALLKRIEHDYPSLEETGCRVGIGVATGADSIFVGRYDDLAVEPERKLPLVVHSDLTNDEIHWQGFGVINPFDEDGDLADFSKWPCFAHYLTQNKRALSARHCAKKNEQRWYRTIDRIYPELVARPKLLIPDLNASMQVIYDEGHFYPHHNLYYVISDTWNLAALQTVLRSSLFRATIDAYSTKMHGGCLRFQAQYLRRFHLPRWADVPVTLQTCLIAASHGSNSSTIEQMIADLYHLSKEESRTFQEATHAF